MGAKNSTHENVTYLKLRAKTSETDPTPVKNEVVTVECCVPLYSDYKYLVLKEYKDNRRVVFRADFFSTLVSDEVLYNELNEILK